VNIETLKYFVELSRTGSFYRAADNAYISQQGLNKAITGLETELGMKLIERRGRQGVRLTERGDVFLSYAEKILADYDDMIGAMLETPSYAIEDESLLDITTTYYLLQIITALKGAQDLMHHVTLHEMPFWQIVEAISDQSENQLFIADLYPEALSRGADYSDISFDPILTTHLGLMWKEGIYQNDSDFIHREEVVDFPFALSSDREVSSWVDWVFRDNPLSNVKMKTSNVKLLIDYVQAGHFSTFDSYGFKLICDDPDIPTEGLRFKPFSTPEGTARVGFLFKKGARPNARCRTYIDLIKRIIA